MANEEQLSILKQGVGVWNKWREENPVNKLSFNEVNLSKSKFEGVNFANVEFNNADFTDAKLDGAIFTEGSLFNTSFLQASIRNVDLKRARLRWVNFFKADLTRTNFEEALIAPAFFHNANLEQANLRKAFLLQATFVDTNLTGTSFGMAQLASTLFANINLGEIKELESVDYGGPSIISMGTIKRSKGKIPIAFLRGCGLSDWEIEEVKLYNPDLVNEEINKSLYKIFDLRASQALQVSPLFISYSQKDGKFVDKIESQLNAKGIRFWRDLHEMKAGRMERQIDRAIRQNPTVLLVLSEHSLGSDWVEHEVRMAREIEKEMKRDVLCPVALDDSWKSGPWPKRVMEQIMEYNILDFSAWEDDDKFNEMFRKLIDGLELFYKG